VHRPRSSLILRIHVLFEKFPTLLDKTEWFANTELVEIDQFLGIFSDFCSKLSRLKSMYRHDIQWRPQGCESQNPNRVVIYLHSFMSLVPNPGIWVRFTVDITSHILSWSMSTLPISFHTLFSLVLFLFHQTNTLVRKRLWIGLTITTHLSKNCKSLSSKSVFLMHLSGPPFLLTCICFVLICVWNLFWICSTFLFLHVHLSLQVLCLYCLFVFYHDDFLGFHPWSQEFVARIHQNTHSFVYIYHQVPTRSLHEFVSEMTLARIHS